MYRSEAENRSASTSGNRVTFPSSWIPAGMSTAGRDVPVAGSTPAATEIGAML